MPFYAHNWKELTTAEEEKVKRKGIKCSYCKREKPLYYGTVHIAMVGTWDKYICGKCYKKYKGMKFSQERNPVRLTSPPFIGDVKGSGRT